MIKTLPMNHMDMEHKWYKNGPNTPQNYIVHPMLVPVLSYFLSYPALKCLQYHPMPQTCVWAVIGDQTLSMNHMDMERKRCKNRPKTPQISIVHPILMHILSYFM